MARSHKWLAGSLSAVLAIVTISWVSAQDTKTPAGDVKAGTAKAGSEKAAGEAAKINEKTAAFQKLRGELIDTIKGLADIQQAYRLANKDGRPALEEEFDVKKARAKKLAGQTAAAAEAAIAVDPTNEEVMDYLGALAYQAFERQSAYEEALRLAQLVLEKQPAGKFRRPELFRLAGVSASYAAKADSADNAAKFAAAEKYLKELQKPEYKEEDILRAPDSRAQLATERGLWEEELKRRKTEEKPASDPLALPRVRLTTTQGDIELELFENEAPNTVANFITLVEKKFYDGKLLGTSKSDVQAGKPTVHDKDMDYTIADECGRKDFRRHFRGSLAMSIPQGKDTGCSEFLLWLEPNRERDPKLIDKNNPTGGATVFGRVVSGIEVLSKLRQAVETRPLSEEPDRITEARVLHKRGHGYQVQKLEKGKSAPSAKPAVEGKTSPEGKTEAAKTGPEKTAADKTEPAKTP